MCGFKPCLWQLRVVALRHGQYHGHLSDVSYWHLSGLGVSSACKTILMSGLREEPAGPSHASLKRCDLLRWRDLNSSTTTGSLKSYNVQLCTCWS